MVFFLLQPEAILLGIARVYKRGCKKLADPSYDGGLGAFIGASPSAWPSRWFPHGSGVEVQESTAACSSMEAVHH